MLGTQIRQTPRSGVPIAPKSWPSVSDERSVSSKLRMVSRGPPAHSQNRGPTDGSAADMLQPRSILLSAYFHDTVSARNGPYAG